LDGTRLRDIFTSNYLKPFYSRFELEAEERAVISNIQKTNTDLGKDDIRDEDNGNENDDNDDNKKKEENREK
jgi:hypothetical protein